MFIYAVHLARLEFVNPLSTLLLVTLFILLVILARLGELVAPESRVYVGDLVCGIANFRCLVWHHRSVYLLYTGSVSPCSLSKDRRANTYHQATVRLDGLHISLGHSSAYVESKDTAHIQATVVHSPDMQSSPSLPPSLRLASVGPS